MDLETLDSLSRVVLLAWSYVQDAPQSGAANVEAVAHMLSWLRQMDDLPDGWETRENIVSVLDLRHH